MKSSTPENPKALKISISIVTAWRDMRDALSALFAPALIAFLILLALRIVRLWIMPLTGLTVGAKTRRRFSLLRFPDWLFPRHWFFPDLRSQARSGRRRERAKSAATTSAWPSSENRFRASKTVRWSQVVAPTQPTFRFRISFICGWCAQPLRTAA